MRFRLALIAIALIVWPVAADEAKLLKTAQGLYEGVRTETLPNGLRVFLKPVPGSPVVSTMVAYKVGAADEELDQTGLSHYLEHLMFKGTDKLAPGDIDRLTQRNGGSNNASTSEDMTVFYFDFAADRWKPGLEVEADRMRNLKIDEKHEFQQEKGAVISELDRDEDEPWDLEQKAMLPLLFGAKTPYGHPVIGEKEHVAKATAEIIKKHYDRWYHPNNAVLVVAGGFDEKDALEFIKKLFGPIPKTDLPARRPLEEPKPRTETVRKRFDSKFNTPRLLYGFNSVKETDPDAIPLDVVTSILTAGKTSRLHHRLIEEDGTCTSIQSGNSTGRYPGYVSIQAELFKAEEIGKVEEAIEAELKRLADEGPTEAELKRVRRSMLATHVFAHESIHALTESIARGVLDNDLAFVQRYLPDLLKVTADDVKRVTKKYLVDRKPVIIESVAKGMVPGKDAPPAKKAVERAGKELNAKLGASFDLKQAKTVTLDNGLKLILLENHRLPMVVAHASVGHVRMYESADKIGVAALMGILLEEGTTTRSGPEIARLIEDTGGSIDMSASGGSVKVLADDTDLGLDLLFDCLIHPKFGKDEIESKQDQLLSSLAEDDKRPESRALRAYRKAIYGDHPLGRPGAKADVVKKLTAKDLKAFHKKVFVPNNTVVAVVGDFDSDKVVADIKKKTADWKAGKLPKLNVPAPPEPGKASQEIISEPSAAQLTVYLGHLGIKRDHPDYYKLLVLDYILGTGTGFTDRLSGNLRDRQGLAYTVEAGITKSAGEEPGTFMGYIGTFPDKFAEVKAGFLKEINRIRDEAPTQEEVEDVQKYLTGSLAFTLTTCESAADLLLAIDRYKLGADYLNDYRKAIAAVTPADIQAVAKKHLNPDKLVVVAAGPVDAAGKVLKKD
jgi:zinc protease